MYQATVVSRGDKRADQLTDSVVREEGEVMNGAGISAVREASHTQRT